MQIHLRITKMVSAIPSPALPLTDFEERPQAVRKDSNRQLWTHVGIIAAFYAGALVLALRPQWVAGFSPQCAMLAIFHIKCPFCGMTRDFVAILHGKQPTLNPFTWAAVAALYIGYPGTFFVAWRKRRLDIFYSPVVYKIGLACLVFMCFVNNFAH
jgi:Protein of unknown function (DUF2752)